MYVYNIGFAMLRNSFLFPGSFCICFSLHKITSTPLFIFLLSRYILIFDAISKLSTVTDFISWQILNLKILVLYNLIKGQA